MLPGRGGCPGAAAAVALLAPKPTWRHRLGRGTVPGQRWVVSEEPVAMEGPRRSLVWQTLRHLADIMEDRGCQKRSQHLQKSVPVSEFGLTPSLPCLF